MYYEEKRLSMSPKGNRAVLKLYIQETPNDKLFLKKRPLILLCPGGGFHKMSYREGEPLALHFMSRGYHAAVLDYSLVPDKHPQQFYELAESFRIIWENRETWHVDTDRIVVHGASAGGYLAALYGFEWKNANLAKHFDMEADVFRPRGIMLSYPVITADPAFAHQGSFANLLETMDAEELSKASLETKDTAFMPPCFIWHTNTDRTVPVMNSLILARRLWEQEKDVELHIFPTGEHGLSLSTSWVQRADGSGLDVYASKWTELADRWLERIFTDKGE